MNDYAVIWWYLIALKKMCGVRSIADDWRISIHSIPDRIAHKRSLDELK